MKIVSIEPTPSPHSMKINLNEELPAGETYNFNEKDDLENAPMYVKQLFSIEGVKNIYRVVDFIALARNPKTPWEELLPKVREVLGTEEDTQDQTAAVNHQPDDSFGEVKVFVQMFRGIPMQVKLDDGTEEKRFGLPEQFTNAAMEASPSSPNVIMDRKWVEQHPRYGSMEEIGSDVIEELSASYDKERLNNLVKMAFEQPGETNEDKATDGRSSISLETLDHPDWKVRYAALDRLDPDFSDLPLLDKALDDEKSSIRRLATAYLGMIEESEVLPYLYKALKDKAVNVRRTAGDCISDLGFKEAMPQMIESLSDSSRIVRWRAAMFLFEAGDETAIPALEAAADDPEFEVRMQIKLALERIKGGEEAKGSVWHQMTQATNRS
ncbi:conserved virulence factor C family protein [Oceanobacillus damuensis]|uniref:conserved virulence factor C family protein n=1 Tax=Oceanobacillus damuensis TaxID=937928 RepID=UPI0008322078|nr:conserved virulence factor C family protein [Oceanobacillus damuensis]